MQTRSTAAWTADWVFAAAPMPQDQRSQPNVPHPSPDNRPRRERPSHILQESPQAERRVNPWEQHAEHTMGSMACTGSPVGSNRFCAFPLWVHRTEQALHANTASYTLHRPSISGSAPQKAPVDVSAAFRPHLCAITRGFLCATATLKPARQIAAAKKTICDSASLKGAWSGKRPRRSKLPTRQNFDAVYVLRRLSRTSRKRSCERMDTALS